MAKSLIGTSPRFVHSSRESWYPLKHNFRSASAMAIGPRVMDDAHLEQIRPQSGLNGTKLLQDDMTFLQNNDETVLLSVIENSPRIDLKHGVLNNRTDIESLSVSEKEIELKEEKVDMHNY